MLWIALHLPLLSLESFAATLSREFPGVDAAADGEVVATATATADTDAGSGAGRSRGVIASTADASRVGPACMLPLALMDARGIVNANPAAQALGVHAGMKRATALALAPQLVLGKADPVRDAQALTAVAHAALAFTPSVVTQPVAEAAPAPHTVLLEVQGSLRYFGGLPALLQRLHDALAPLGHRIHTVCAPTAQGAAWLACIHRALRCADLTALRTALDAAPTWLPAAGHAHQDTLEGMGLRTLGELRRQPRAGLARRFGEGLLEEMDRAYGHRPDPREPLTLPATFDSRLELFARADTTEQVLHGAGVLLQRLVAWLGAQHAFVRRFTLMMQHETHRRSRSPTPVPTQTRLDIALAEPARDAAHLHVLLRERLAQLSLPAPTLDLQLHASDIARRAPPNGELFPTAGSEREGLTRLIERLQARLGPEQVQRLVRVQDHRPECSSELRAADPPALASARPARRGAGVAAASAAAGGRNKPTRPSRALLPEPTLRGGVAVRPTARSVMASVGTHRQAGPVGGLLVGEHDGHDTSDERDAYDVCDTNDAHDAQGRGHAHAAANANANGQTQTPQTGRVTPVPAADTPCGLRPVWLLDPPEPLPERQSRPLLDGRPLQLLSGPERIEAGWWDAALAERDYFIAQTAEGALVWIYRARLPLSAAAGAQGWFLQGRFA